MTRTPQEIDAEKFLLKETKAFEAMFARVHQPLHRLKFENVPISALKASGVPLPEAPGMVNVTTIPTDPVGSEWQETPDGAVKGWKKSVAAYVGKNDLSKMELYWRVEPDLMAQYDFSAEKTSYAVYSRFGIKLRGDDVDAR